MTIKVMTSLSRRKILQAAGAATALTATVSTAMAQDRQSNTLTPIPRPGKGMPIEAPDTPHICLDLSVSDIPNGGIERVAQLGVTHVILGGVHFPLEEASLTAQVKSLKEAGLAVGDYHLPGLDNVVFGRPGRDKDIEDVKTSIRAAGKAGIPVLQYTLFSVRMAGGYFEAPDPQRGNAVLRAFDYDRVKGLPPLPGATTHSHEELWANAAYFIKAIAPTAEAAGVRLAQHPNDPPGPVSRGSHQIMATVEDWMNFMNIVDSPVNGMVFDCGIVAELGKDPVAVARLLGQRDRINHVHYRNVVMRTPRQFYTETYPDMGDNDMLAIMKELVRQKYPRLILPEHARGLTFDRVNKDNEYAAWAYQVGYTRAMLQAALMDR